MLRLLISLAVAMLTYVIYWSAISRRHGVRLTWWNRTAAECRLRSGRLGVGRLFLAWAVSLTVFAFAREDSRIPFTYSWLQECILKWDWIFVLIAASILAFAEWHHGKQRLATYGSAER